MTQRDAVKEKDPVWCVKSEGLWTGWSVRAGTALEAEKQV